MFRSYQLIQSKLQNNVMVFHLGFFFGPSLTLNIDGFSVMPAICAGTLGALKPIKVPCSVLQFKM